MKNCSERVIIIKEQDNQNIYKESNCLFISGNESEILKSVDAFVYKTLEII